MASPSIIWMVVRNVSCRATTPLSARSNASTFSSPRRRTASTSLYTGTPGFNCAMNQRRSCKGLSRYGTDRSRAGMGAAAAYCSGPCSEPCAGSCSEPRSEPCSEPCPKPCSEPCRGAPAEAFASGGRCVCPADPWRSRITAAKSVTVPFSKKSVSVRRTPILSRSLETHWIANSESPPKAKKLSFAPTCGALRSSVQMPAIISSIESGRVGAKSPDF